MAGVGCRNYWCKLDSIRFPFIGYLLWKGGDEISENQDWPNYIQNPLRIHFFGKKGIPPTGYSDNFLRDMEYLFSWKLYQVIFLDCDDNNRVKIKYSKKKIVNMLSL